MEDNNKLIPVNNSLVSIERQLTIGEKLLSLSNNENEKIKEFFVEVLNSIGYRTFLRYVFEYFPISHKIIEKYEGIIFWEYLSCNKKVKFTEELFEKYPQWRTHASSLARNKSVNWNLKLIKKFENDIDWTETNHNWLSALPWSNELVKLYSEKLNWERFSRYEFFPWTEDFIYNYSSKLDWENISTNKSIPWTEDFIDKNKYRLNWKYLSSNPNLPWSEDFIEKHKNNWDWKNLSQNTELPWSKDFFCKYINNWSLNDISGNRGIKWDEDFFNEFLNYKNAIWGWLSYCCLPWSKELILKYKDKWDWRLLTINENIVWTDEMVNLFYDEIRWDVICENKSFKLDLDFFINNLKKYHKNGSFFYRIVKLTEAYLDDDFIEELISNALNKTQKNGYVNPYLFNDMIKDDYINKQFE